MEAPKKIYLTTFGFPICEPIPQESSNPDTVWSKKPYTDADSIEYIRTDAFIDKALAYLNSKFYFNNAFYGVVSTDFNSMEEMFEGFINYMKGE